VGNRGLGEGAIGQGRQVERNTVRQEARTRLTSHPTSAAAARRFVRDVLNQWQAVGNVASVLLCTDELVTNAIVHVASEFDVVVRHDGDVLRIEVHDSSDRPPLRRVPDLEAESGRGLQLVEALSSRWGVDGGGDGPGKAVWFEVQAESACS
jgi:two-component sensor histidine kinase